MTPAESKHTDHLLIVALPAGYSNSSGGVSSHTAAFSYRVLEASLTKCTKVFHQIPGTLEHICNKGSHSHNAMME